MSHLPIPNQQLLSVDLKMDVDFDNWEVDKVSQQIGKEFIKDWPKSPLGHDFVSIRFTGPRDGKV